MTLNRKLASLRKKEGLSQAEVSEKLDVSRQAVSRWESGDSKPSIENLQSLCRLYNVPLDYMLDESENGPPGKVSERPVEEHRLAEDVQKKRKLWIRRLMIIVSVVAVVLVVCSYSYYNYKKSQEENDLDLHAIQGEHSTLPEESDFDLNWD